MLLPTRTLGHGDPEVTAIDFGLIGISGIYGPRGNDDEVWPSLDRAHEFGE
jgi:hypothetical protein